jgi:hypothetical protein
MTSARPGPVNAQSLPTLTEVIETPLPPRGSANDHALAFHAIPVLEDVVEGVASAFAAVPAFDEEQVVQRVLADLQRHADLMLEYRLREALAPALARLTDALIRDARQELAATLRDIVVSAVSQELARQRGR